MTIDTDLVQTVLAREWHECDKDDDYGHWYDGARTALKNVTIGIGGDKKVPDIGWIPRPGWEGIFDLMEIGDRGAARQYIVCQSEGHTDGEPWDGLCAACVALFDAAVQVEGQ